MNSVMKAQSNSMKYQKGLAAIEFAIVVPVLIFMMLATAEYGRAFYEYNTLVKTVQAGARYASRPLLNPSELTSLDADFKNRIRNFVVYGNENGAGKPVLTGFKATEESVAITSDVADKTITIQARYIFNFSVLGNFPLLNYYLPTITLRASAVTDTSLG